MIKAGDRVRVRKGTQIFTTHPKKRTVTAGTHTVKVHHVLPPYEELLAERIHYKDGPQVHLRLDDIEQRQLLQRLGMPTQTSQEVQTGIEQLLATARVAVPLLARQRRVFLRALGT